MYAFVVKNNSLCVRCYRCYIDRCEKCVRFCFCFFSVRMTNVECTHVECGSVRIAFLYLTCVTVRLDAECLPLKECVIPDHSQCDDDDAVLSTLLCRASPAEAPERGLVSFLASLFLGKDEKIIYIYTRLSVFAEAICWRTS